MSFQFRLVSKLFVFSLAALTLLACQPSQITPSTTSELGQITPYWTATPSPTATTQWTRSATATAIPATVPPPPTPTPYTYVIVKGDTMGVIAYRFGVTVADLRAANPEVDPNMMSIGTVLVIPIIETNEAGTPEALATPTPVSIQMSQPNCYQLESEGAWCLALAHNSQDRALENLIAWIQLVSSDGEVLAGQQAIPPLNLLPAGQNLPVMAYFPEAQPNASPQVELISALPLLPNDQRYRPVALQIERTEISPDGLRATVQGTLTLLASPSPTPPQNTPEPDAPEVTLTPTGEETTEDHGAASQIWLAVIAYDANNLPIGVRKWEAPAGLSTGARMPFEIAVFSLGPKIAHVEVLAEARP